MPQVHYAALIGTTMYATNVRELLAEIVVGWLGALVVLYALGLLFGSLDSPSWVPPCPRN